MKIKLNNVLNSESISYSAYICIMTIVTNNTYNIHAVPVNYENLQCL